MRWRAKALIWSKEFCIVGNLFKKVKHYSPVAMNLKLFNVFRPVHSSWSSQVNRKELPDFIFQESYLIPAAFLASISTRFHKEGMVNCSGRYFEITGTEALKEFADIPVSVSAYIQ
ncbi:MAG: hypothetical protein GY820_19325 [Gammaproteobacteria bacterium]|nr:hypothetical protein [Gammaproteobacteria bacterium]